MVVNLVELIDMIKDTVKSIPMSIKIQEKVIEDVIDFKYTMTGVLSGRGEALRTIGRVLDDMKKFKFGKPDTSPTREAVEEITSRMVKPFITVSCRGSLHHENDHPSFKIHGRVDSIIGDLKRCRDRELIIYVHGYNVDNHLALKEAQDIFTKLQRSLIENGKELEDYEFMLFTWPGDAGVVKFSEAQLYAQYSGNALYDFLLKLKREWGVKDINLLAHSLGAHVVLRSADLMEKHLTSGRDEFSYKNVILMGAAVEEDIFEGSPSKRYHFPRAPYAMDSLYIITSRADLPLKIAFNIMEQENALGCRGINGGEKIAKVPGVGEEVHSELHDLSPLLEEKNSSKPLVYGHIRYWETQKHTDYYVHLMYGREAINK
ncbi:hypothetical protein PM10SUCC1_21420 [Propionigenium maris DSM 9537]|uniref:Alpha/beta hydrolase n=1 Tax=Propionigenium maris DSM 9537 TaxID=1123000 RepID=A0A9W6LNI1_9FUSO|nr:alpha/beta hydrolase [Propionigenium maris]GLI56628.1 hypothetical protein PM10SUCC1_21420 [Propionigenium maris DSM 9537]